MHSAIRICCVLVALGASVSAQPRTLQQLEAEAVKNNLPLLAQRFDLDAAEADIITAGLFPNNPSLTLVGDILPTGKLFQPDQKSWGASVHVPLELGGKRDARGGVAESGRAMVRAQFADAMRSLLLAVRSAYFDALNAKASLDFAKSNASALDSIALLNRIRLASHDIAESELLRSEMAAEQQRLAVESSQADAAQASTALQAILGRREFSATFEAAGDLLQPPLPFVESLEEAKSLAHAHRSDLQHAAKGVESAAAMRRLQEAMAVIDLDVSADFSRQQGETFYGMSLSIPLPLLNRNEGERQKAAIRAEQSHALLSAALQRADAEVEGAWRDFSARRAIVQRIERDLLPRARSIRATVEYTYRKGATTILDFLDAQRSFSDSMRQYYDALTALHKSAASMRAALGTDEF
jgi:cobalt-zinc-cadmium efflux system outer membrane protein